jgi:hypothetical protein
MAWRVSWLYVLYTLCNLTGFSSGRLDRDKAIVGSIRECARIALEALKDQQNFASNPDFVLISVQNIVQLIIRGDSSGSISQENLDDKLLELLDCSQVEAIINQFQEDQLLALFSYLTYSWKVDLSQEGLERVSRYIRICLMPYEHLSRKARDSIDRDKFLLMVRHLDRFSDAQQAALILHTIVNYANDPRTSLEWINYLLHGIWGSTRRFQFDWTPVLGLGLMDRLSQIPETAEERNNWRRCIEHARLLESNPPGRSWTRIEEALEAAGREYEG